MISRILLGALLILPMTAPGSIAAQTKADITLKVPVILTQLAPEVTALLVRCEVRSDAVVGTDPSYPKSESKSANLSVSGGEVVEMVTLNISVNLQNPAGKSAVAACTLQGWDKSTASWVYFNENAANPAFRTTPSVFPIQNTFDW